jgi:hypothetical protein
MQEQVHCGNGKPKGGLFQIDAQAGDSGETKGEGNNRYCAAADAGGNGGPGGVFWW